MFGLDDIIGGVVSIGSSIIGGIASGNERAKAQAAMDAALSEISKTGAPPDQSKEIIYEKFKQAGILTPELENKIEVEFSNLANISEDPSLRQAGMSALESLRQRGQTGFGPEDRAAYEKLKAATEANAEAKRQQIIQNAQARGMPGSGAELAAQLQAGQSGASRLSQEGMDILGQASRNALDSLSKYGTMASNIRGEDFNVNKTRAGAADDLARFNAANSLAQQQRNISAKNEAARINLANSQDIANRNTLTYNQELLRQKQAERQNYLDRAQQAREKSSIYSGQAPQYNANAEREGQGWQNIGTGLAGVAKDVFGKSDQDDDSDEQDALRKKDLFGFGD